MGNSVNRLKDKLSSSEFGTSDKHTAKAIRDVRRASADGRISYADLADSKGIVNLIDLMRSGSLPQRDNSCVTLLSLLRNTQESDDDADDSREKGNIRLVVEQAIQNGILRATVQSMRDVVSFLTAVPSFIQFERSNLAAASEGTGSKNSSGSRSNESYDSFRKQPRRYSLGDERLIQSQDTKLVSTLKEDWGSETRPGNGRDNYLAPAIGATHEKKTSNDVPDSPRSRSSAPAEFSRKSVLSAESVSSAKASEHLENASGLLILVLKYSDTHWWRRSLRGKNIGLLLRWIILYHERSRLVFNAFTLLEIIFSSNAADSFLVDSKKMFFSEFTVSLKRLLCIEFDHSRIDSPADEARPEGETLDSEAIVDCVTSVKKALLLISNYFCPEVSTADDILSTNVIGLLLAIVRDSLIYLEVMQFEDGIAPICSRSCAICQSRQLIEDEDLDERMRSLLEDLVIASLHCICVLLPVNRRSVFLSSCDDNSLSALVGKANRDVCCGLTSLIAALIGLYDEATIESPMADLITLQKQEVKETLDRSRPEMGFGPMKSVIVHAPPLVCFRHLNEGSKKLPNRREIPSVEGVSDPSTIEGVDEEITDSAFASTSQKKSDLHTRISPSNLSRILEVLHVFSAYGDDSVIKNLWDAGMDVALQCILADHMRHMVLWYHEAISDVNGSFGNNNSPSPFWKPKRSSAGSSSPREVKERRLTYAPRHLPQQGAMRKRHSGGAILSEASHSLNNTGVSKSSVASPNESRWLIYHVAEEIRKSMPTQLSEEQCAESMMALNIALHMTTWRHKESKHTYGATIQLDDKPPGTFFSKFPKNTCVYVPVMPKGMLANIVRFVALLRESLPAPPENRHLRQSHASFHGKSFKRQYHSEGDVGSLSRRESSRHQDSQIPLAVKTYTENKQTATITQSFTFDREVNPLSKPSGLSSMESNFSRRRHRSLSFVLRANSVTPLKPNAVNVENVENPPEIPEDEQSLNVLQFPSYLRNSCSLAMLTLAKIMKQISISATHTLVMLFASGALPADFVLAAEFVRQPRPSIRRWRRESTMSPNSYEEEAQPIHEDNMGALFKANSTGERRQSETVSEVDTDPQTRFIAGALVIADAAVRVLGSRKMPQRVVDAAGSVLYKLCLSRRMREALAVMNFCSIDALAPQLQHRRCSLQTRKNIAHILFLLSTVNEDICDFILVDKEIQFGLTDSIRVCRDNAPAQLPLLRLISRASEGASTDVKIPEAFAKSIYSSCVPILYREHPSSIRYQVVEELLQSLAQRVPDGIRSQIKAEATQMRESILEAELSMAQGRQLETTTRDSRVSPQSMESPRNTMSSQASAFTSGSLEKGGKDNQVPGRAEARSSVGTSKKTLPKLVTSPPDEDTKQSYGIVSPASASWQRERRSSIGSVASGQQTYLSSLSKPPTHSNSPRKNRSAGPSSTTAVTQKKFWHEYDQAPAYSPVNKSTGPIQLPSIVSPLSSQNGGSTTSPLKNLWHGTTSKSRETPRKASPQNRTLIMHEFKPSHEKIPDEVTQSLTLHEGLPSLPEHVTEQPW
eukprot:gb/GECG01010938.1/.p1 GENE.gb/GECG01010938.1/~~gb/GECG01010938.1/.p1  ORF type:complete len:1547 (+),score=172.42 gb/GECG01010938.1/:1-4641(+)